MRLILFASLVAACTPITRGAPETRPDGAIPVAHGVVAAPELTDEIDAAMLPILADGGAGLGVAIVKDGAVFFTAGYGWADLGDDRALDADTPMQVGSVSKTFIGVAAMQAVQAKVLTLDTPISDLVGFSVDNPKVDGDTISLRHLLTHTSGIRDSRKYESSYADGPPTVSLMDFERGYLTEGGDHYVAGNYANRLPGTFAYSNVAAALAGLGLGEARGLEYADLVARDILAPLGMTHTAFFHADLPVEAATLYANRNRAWTPYSFPTYPDGLLKTSPNDIGRFLAAMQGGGELDGVSILDADLVDEMLNVDETIGTDEAGQAVVWARMDLFDDRATMGHSGGDPGVGALMAMDRDAGVGVVFIVNNLDVDVEVLFQGYEALFDLAEAAP